MLGLSQEDATDTRVSNVKFINQSAAAIKDLRSKDQDYTTVWKDQSNDFCGLLGSAVQYTHSHSPLGFREQPVSTMVHNGDTAVFKVVVSGQRGTPTISLQWQRNNTDIPGAISLTYSFLPTKADNNSKYRVIAAKGDEKVTSVEAILTVLLKRKSTHRNEAGMHSKW